MYQDKPVMMGLLPASRYNSISRLSLLRELTSIYVNNTVEVETRIDIKKSDLIYDSQLYFNLQEMTFPLKEWILRCFLLFSINVTRRYDANSIVFTYENYEYVVPILIINSFLFHKQYVRLEAYIDIEADYKLNLNREVEIIPARKSAVGGQEKIMVDAVLTIDALKVFDKLKICIVGSSHDSRISTRSAYYPLFYMVTNSEFYLYDMLEEEGTDIINTNKIHRYRKPYMYEDMTKYDVFLDDAYIQGRTAIESIVKAKVTLGFPIWTLYPQHYSIKIFSNSVEGNYYHQVVETVSGEMRLVSRVITPNFKQRLKLGRCPFCRELKYFLKRNYSDEFYERILQNHRDHKKDCYPSEWYYKRFDKEKNEYKSMVGAWEKVPKSKFKVVGGVFHIKDGPEWSQSVRRIVIDCQFNNIAVELREEHIRLVDIVISDDLYLTSNIIAARNVYKWDGEACFKLKKDTVSESYTFSGDSVGYLASHLMNKRANKEDRNKKLLDKERQLKPFSTIDYGVEGPMIDMYHNREMKYSKIEKEYRRIERSLNGFGPDDIPDD